MTMHASITRLRRLALLAAALSPFAAIALAQAQTNAPPAPAAAAVVVERDGNGRSIQDLYQAALKEGGTLTVYAGGDEVTQGFGIKAGFERTFPGLKIDIVVDLSK